jgi:VCBS repeat-containing protein
MIDAPASLSFWQNTVGTHRRPTMRKRLLSILALTILVTSTLAGCSENPSDSSTITILSITEGTVLVMKTGTDSWTEAKSGTSLGVGDTVKTGDDSGAEITFFDGSTVELEAGTQIQITSLDSPPGTDAKTITLMQTIGTTISRVTKLLDPASTYAVETPNGVAAVRGTTMIVTVEYVTPQIINTLVTMEEGHAVFIGHGGELQVPEGRQAFADDVIIELVPLNRPPVAVSDSYITDEDTPLMIGAPGVLSNDSDPDVGDTLTVTSLDTAGTLGTVTAWGLDGSFTYNPSEQFEYLGTGESSTDSFTYTVSDGNGGTDTAAVTITINGVYDPPVYDQPVPPVYDRPENHPPVAGNDIATTAKVTSVTINVLGNDFDPDGDTLAVCSVSQASNGSVASNGNYVTYTPNSDFSGTDSFTYTICDGNGGTATATVTVTVTKVNNPPEAVDDSDTTPQGTPVTINVLGNDSDPDGDTLTLDSVGPAGNGTVTSNGNDVTYTPSGNFVGSDSFTYTVSDGNGGTDTATVTIIVTAIETSARISVQVDPENNATIYIWDTTTHELVTDGSQVTPKTIEVTGGHSYCVLVERGCYTYLVRNCPAGWSGEGGPIACGFAVAGNLYSIHFTESAN